VSGAAVAADLVGTSLAAALSAPQDLLDSPQARFVKDHRRTAVAATTVDGREVYVKRFKPYAWYRRLEWMVAPSPALRCWTQSTVLEQAGFRVAPPLAFADTRRWGLPADCYFVTASVPETIPAARFWVERAAGSSIAERRGPLEALARELRRFHDAGFYSRDANADNFLLRVDRRGATEVFLLDLENVRRVGRVSRRRRVKNLVQMYGPLRDRVALRDRLRFVRAYHGERLSRIRDWLDDLAAFDARKDAEYRARRRAG
jgi:Lipopolysaccharide kinase (Kdo/WaaP) family